MSKVYSFDRDPGEFLTARDSGKRLQIDTKTFDYFLGVLPPVSLGHVYELDNNGTPQLMRTTFGFAEGAERVTAFWRDRDGKKNVRYWCQRTNVINRG